MLNKFVNKLHYFVRKARPYIPFTELNTVYHFMDKNAKSILDVGCGRGEPMKFINRDKKFYTIGADIFELPLKECRRVGVHDDLVLCDIRSLPFKKKNFDIVLCLTVIEHLEKEEGEKLFREMEAIARKQVIISTPVGRYKLGTFDGNPYQEHKYIWDPTEFKKRGYNVRGVGIRGLLGKGGFRSHLPRIIHPFTWMLWILAGPVVHFLPKLAGTQVCAIKKSLKDNVKFPPVH